MTVVARDEDEEMENPDLLPYEVEFTVIVHVMAENEDAAMDKAEPFAVQAARAGTWTNYDDCIRVIEKSDF